MNKTLTVVLASASPRRKELLEQIGLMPLVIPSEADEDLDITDPKELVLALSRAKCIDVAVRLVHEADGTEQNAIVIGADTVVCIDGEILGKPKDRKDADRMLSRLSGRPHMVLTGVSMARLSGGKLVEIRSFSEQTAVFVEELSAAERAAYIETDEPMDKAGAYGIQGFFGRHIGRIEGDYYNVVGLPVCAVYQTLKGMTNEL